MHFSTPTSARGQQRLIIQIKSRMARLHVSSLFEIEATQKHHAERGRLVWGLTKKHTSEADGPRAAHKRSAAQDQQGKRRRKPESAARTKDKSGRDSSIPIKDARRLLAEWHTNPAKPEWVQLKIFLPRFEEYCKPKEPNESWDSYGSRVHRAKEVGYLLQSSFAPILKEFCRGYLYLKKHGAPLLTFAEALDRHPTDPTRMFQELLDSLASWDSQTHPVPAKRTKSTQPAHSVGKIIPFLKELKVFSFAHYRTFTARKTLKMRSPTP